MCAHPAAGAADRRGQPDRPTRSASIAGLRRRAAGRRPARRARGRGGRAGRGTRRLRPVLPALPAPARRLFRLLGLVPGADVTPEAAAALAGTDRRQAALLLDRLAGAHLIDPARAGPVRTPRPVAPLRCGARQARGKRAGTRRGRAPPVRLVPVHRRQRGPAAVPGEAAAPAPRDLATSPGPISPTTRRRWPGWTPNDPTCSPPSGTPAPSGRGRPHGCSPMPCAATSGCACSPSSG